MCVFCSTSSSSDGSLQINDDETYSPSAGRARGRGGQGGGRRYKEDHEWKKDFREGDYCELGNRVDSPS